MIKIQQLFTSPGYFTWFRTIPRRFSTNVIFECILILSSNIRYEFVYKQSVGVPIRVYFFFSLNSRLTKGIASTCMIFDWFTFQSKMNFRLTKFDSENEWYYTYCVLCDKIIPRLYVKRAGRDNTRWPTNLEEG